MKPEPNESQENLDQKIWEENMLKLRRLCDEVYNKVKTLYPNKSAMRFNKMMRERVDFLLESKPATMDELKQYAAFHTFIGSTVTYQDTPIFDLPGDLSITKFLQEKLAELKAEKE